MRGMELGGQHRLDRRNQLVLELPDQIVSRIIPADPAQTAIAFVEDLKIERRNRLAAPFKQPGAPFGELRQLRLLARGPVDNHSGENPVALQSQTIQRLSAARLRL